MSIRCLIFVLLATFPIFAVVAQEKGKVHYNIGMKAGFQAVTYNDPEFDIEGYKFDTNNIQSNKIGYALSVFARVTKSKFYLQTEGTFGITNHSFVFKINGIDAVKFASQGQQRTLVLALKLGELEIIKEKTGFSPILLLDDVLAELDENRQNYLLKSIEKDVQTIITSVDTLLFEDEFLKDVQIYSIENGNIKV